MNTIRYRLRKGDGNNELVQVKHAVGDRSMQSILKKGEVVRHVFFLPNTAVPLVLRCGIVILADVTHQLKFGGYAPWHAILKKTVGWGILFSTP